MIRKLRTSAFALLTILALGISTATYVTLGSLASQSEVEQIASDDYANGGG